MHNSVIIMIYYELKKVISKMIGKFNKAHAVVIKIEQKKRRDYHVSFNDYLGEIYEFTIHEETMLDYRLVVGKELDEETFYSLVRSRDYQLAYRYAIGILARRMYTEKEIRQKLMLKETAEDVVQEVVAKLSLLNLLNDEAYATAYIENQVISGKKSKYQIISEMQKKGIASSIINNRMDLFDKNRELELINHEIEKAYNRYSRKGFSDFKISNMVMQTLGRKGFDFEDIKRQYGFFIEDLKG